MSLLRPCITCGQPTNGPRCPDHQPEAPRSKHTMSATQRGYDARWQRLSRRARRMQPWCSDCGTSSDLTADHLRWPARTLGDVEVVCRACNSRRGPLRSSAIASPPNLRTQDPHDDGEHEDSDGDDDGDDCDVAHRRDQGIAGRIGVHSGLRVPTNPRGDTPTEGAVDRRSKPRSPSLSRRGSL